MNQKEEYEFEISLNDLWSYERTEFEKNGLPIDFCVEVLGKMTSLIVKQTEPFVEKQEEGDKEYTYWKSKLAEYRDSFNANNPFYSDLIYSGGAFYSHYTDLIVKATTENFDLWFALKMRQYDNQLFDLSKFLEYHLSASFNSELPSYIRFVTLVIRQFKEAILSERVVLTASEWLESFAPKTEKPTTILLPKSNKVGRTIKGKFDSFLFDRTNKKLREFENHPNNWSDLNLKLANQGFITKDTKMKNLQKVFNNVEMEKDKRIVWAGTNKELQWFVKYFVYEKEFVENPGNDIWLITQKCFVKNDGKEYSIKMLSDANGNNLKRKEHLYKILDDAFGS